MENNLEKQINDFHASKLALLLYTLWTIILLVGDAALIFCFVDGSSNCGTTSFDLILLIPMIICIAICILCLIGIHICVFALLYLWFYEWVKRKNNG